MTFIKLPEIQIDTDAVLSFVLALQPDDWKLLEWGQYVYWKFGQCEEIIKLKNMFSEHVKYGLIECMCFGPGTSLPIHHDGAPGGRPAVIQIPLSRNCALIPTLFYNDKQELTSKIEWTDNSAWMFNSHELHSIHNTTTDPRYMLCVSFYKMKYGELLDLYNSYKFFK